MHSSYSPRRATANILMYFYFNCKLYNHKKHTLSLSSYSSLTKGLALTLSLAIFCGSTAPNTQNTAQGWRREWWGACMALEQLTLEENYPSLACALSGRVSRKDILPARGRHVQGPRKLNVARA